MKATLDGQSLGEPIPFPITPSVATTILVYEAFDPDQPMHRFRLPNCAGPFGWEGKPVRFAWEEQGNPKAITGTVDRKDVRIADLGGAIEIQVALYLVDCQHEGGPWGGRRLEDEPQGAPYAYTYLRYGRLYTQMFRTLEELKAQVWNDYEYQRAVPQAIHQDNQILVQARDLGAWSGWVGEDEEEEPR